MFEEISRVKPRSRQRPLSEILDLDTGGPARAIRSTLGRRVQLAIKRAIDIGFAFGALFALWLPILVLCVTFRRALVSVPTRGRHGTMFRRFGFAFPVGRFAYFMEESGLSRLPEFINLLTGEMSLVGPAPDITASGTKLPMRPGLIGCADPDYADGFSLAGDFWIILSVVLGRRH